MAETCVPNMIDVNRPKSNPWNCFPCSLVEDNESHLEEKEENEYHSGRGGVGGAGLPVAVDTGDEVVDAEEEAVVGEATDVEGEEKGDDRNPYI